MEKISDFAKSNMGVHVCLDPGQTLCGLIFNIDTGKSENTPVWDSEDVVDTDEKIVTCELCIDRIKKVRSLTFACELIDDGLVETEADRTSRFDETLSIGTAEKNRPRIHCPHCETIFDAREMASKPLGKNKYGIHSFACVSCHKPIKVDPYEYIATSEMLAQGKMPEGMAIGAYKINDLVPFEKDARKEQGWFARLFS